MGCDEIGDDGKETGNKRNKHDERNFRDSKSKGVMAKLVSVINETKRSEAMGSIPGELVADPAVALIGAKVTDTARNSALPAATITWLGCEVDTLESGRRRGRRRRQRREENEAGKVADAIKLSHVLERDKDTVPISLFRYQTRLVQGTALRGKRDYAACGVQVKGEVIRRVGGDWELRRRLRGQ